MAGSGGPNPCGGRSREPLNEMVGLCLSSVEFVHGYIQFHVTLAAPNDGALLDFFVVSRTSRGRAAEVEADDYEDSVQQPVRDLVHSLHGSHIDDAGY